jgi:hypothetical protein
MTGYESKKAMAQAKLHEQYDDMYIVYLNGVYDGKKQRPWVGLTEEEKDGKRVLENGLLFNAAEVQAWELGIDYAEAKLKEKNNAT